MIQEMQLISKSKNVQCTLFFTSKRCICSQFISKIHTIYEDQSHVIKKYSDFI